MMLKVEHINVSYGEIRVLWDISFEIYKGEIVAVVGSNGAGKTTLLKTISGLLIPSSGNIEFLGKRIDGLPPYIIAREGIAHVPEGRQIFPFLTVLENLKMGAYANESKRNKEETLEWIFRLFPVLKERSNQIAGTLSGGERQMLAIARGLMMKPKLLMMDEPSLGLAPKIVSEIFEIIEKLHEKGLTILLVEQNVHHALELASRAYVLETGKIVLEGKGELLLNNPEVKKAYLGI